MKTSPFQISASPQELSELRTRLLATRWPRVGAEYGWTRGVNLSYLKGLVDYWLEDFDWPHHERAINSSPQFEVHIGSQRVHFAHIRTPSHAPLPPLLLLHGWPSSFLEMLRLAPGLQGGGNLPGSDLVIPSLPGFGFSSLPSERNRGIIAHGEVLHTLMTKVLGYDRYICHGTDWGAAIATRMALAHPESLVGLHLTGSPLPQNIPRRTDLTTDELVFLAERDRWLDEEGAYFHQFRTRPTTPAVGAEDSPAGLAAWFAEKWHAWSGASEEVDRPFPADDLISVVMIYWLSRSFATSVLIYAESYEQMRIPAGSFVTVPTAYASFKQDISVPPQSWVARSYNLVQWLSEDFGGHFPAYERTETLAEDIRTMAARVSSQGGNGATAISHPQNSDGGGEAPLRL